MKWQCSATSGATNEPAVEGRDGGEDLEEQADSFVLMHMSRGNGGLSFLQTGSTIHSSNVLVTLGDTEECLLLAFCHQPDDEP